MNYAIQTKGLGKRFGKRVAVRDLELCVPEGALFALLGLNGAGKSTTVRMLSGLIPPDAGEAWVSGYRITEESMSVKQVIGVSPQEIAVARRLTVEENLSLVAGVLCADRVQARRRVEELISLFSLGGVRRQYAGTLSGGWQRRLSIAMALAGEVKVLFLDEPTLGLDVVARRELWRFIEALKGRMTVVLTTHYMEEAEALADLVGVMCDGRLCACGSPAELMQSTGTESLEEAFLSLSGGEGREGKE